MKKPFLERLKEGVIICDGAMGTLLDLKGYTDIPREIHNIKNPDIIKSIHIEYINSGAEIIETNTFQGNRARLSSYFLQDRIKEINFNAVKIAKEAAGKNIYVAGAVGPTGKILEPVGKLKRAEARDIFKEQIEYLLESGVDLLMLETFVSLNELDEAIDAAKSLIDDDIPIVAQKTFPEDGSILSGDFPIEVTRHLLEKKVDVIGANCTVGPQRMFSIIKSMYKEGIFLSAQPAAGIPTLLDSRSVYSASPGYLAIYARQLVEAGVTLIGACCGSTPDHIKAIADSVKDLKNKGHIIGSVEKNKVQIKSSEPKKESPILQIEKEVRFSNFYENIGKKLLISVELDIPRGMDMSSVLSGAEAMKRIGVDAVNITDGARARFRMNPFALSYEIQTRINIETMTHFTCRDRNMIGLQSDLLGAHTLGIKNILVITGDPTNVGDYPQARSVYDVDSIGLLKILSSMNNGEDIMGNSITGKTGFLLACAVNPVGSNLDKEIDKLEKKVESGAQIVFTQPIFEMETLENFLNKIHHIKIPIMLGILPLRSFKHAEFLHNEIPGLYIPHNIRKTIYQSKSQTQTGIDISREFLSQAKKFISGVYLMPPFQKYEVVSQIIQVL
jgi:methionine synthase / methylenetetrahydrofolate reductase(NADPH)